MARDTFGFVTPLDSVDHEIFKLVHMAWMDGRLVRFMVPASELNGIRTALVHAEVELRILGFDAVESVLPVPPFADTVDHNHVIPGRTQDEPTIRILLQPSK